MSTCPISQEPLLKPFHTVADSALNRLTTQTMHLAATMRDVHTWLAASAPPGAGIQTQPGSRPPLKLGALEAVDEHRDTINAWAFRLLQHLNPAVRYRNADWQQAQAIYQLAKSPRFRHQTQTWPHTPTLIDEVLDALRQLERTMTPPETPRLTENQRQEAIATLETDWHPLPKALHLCQQIYGQAPTRQQVYNWKHRGQIETRFTTPHYRVPDLHSRLQATPTPKPQLKDQT